MADELHTQTKTGLARRYEYVAYPANLYGSWYLLYKITRNVTKQYTIVGLYGYDKAKSVANSKASEYFVTSAGPYISDTGQSAVISYSDVGFHIAECVPVHTAGCLWQVDVNVNRIDEAWTFNKPTGDLANYFPAAKYPDPSNNYDENMSSRQVSAQAVPFDQAEQEGEER